VNQEIAAFNVAENVAESNAKDIKKYGAVTERLRFSTRIAPVFYQFWALALVLGISAVMSFRDPADASSLAPLMLLLLRGLGYGKQLQTATQSCLELQPYVRGLMEELEKLEGFQRATGGRPIDSLQSVELINVSYSYASGIPPVLTDVNLTIARGETLGIVGPSGGGKTTLTQLLMRLRPQGSGQILVNGVPLDDVDSASWARLVAFVPQDNKIIRGSVADNIRFYRSGFTDDQIESAARVAHLHDEIAQMPDGYATEIGPAARELSGGQRQRLGIARALLGGPQLLVLDEPTSALDTRSEELIRESLDEIRHRIAIVVVAHRPATVALCDVVVRVEHGRVHALAEPGGRGTR
jgi:ABC-type multidrug transport system fused ATPase/permease subunit